MSSLLYINYEALQAWSSWVMTSAYIGDSVNSRLLYVCVFADDKVCVTVSMCPDINGSLCKGHPVLFYVGLLQLFIIIIPVINIMSTVSSSPLSLLSSSSLQPWATVPHSYGSEIGHFWWESPSATQCWEYLLQCMAEIKICSEIWLIFCCN